MNPNLTQNNYSRLKNTLNLIAGAMLVFNFLNPHLATAQITQASEVLEPTISIEPGSRLNRQAVKPRIIKGVITAYTSTADQTDSNPLITASGKKVNEYTIAGNGLPFGTVIKIPSLFGDKKFIVTDRMNSRYGFGRFDIWLNASRAEALKFGVKKVTIEIYYQETELAVK
ncbi:MAG: hypothetical protein WC725_03150 [Patescibacteria group bacterium]